MPNNPSEFDVTGEAQDSTRKREGGERGGKLVKLHPDDPPPRKRGGFAASGDRIAIALQGGGTHAAFSAGVMARLLEEPALWRQIVGVSGTSGGAHSAAIAWYWLHRGLEIEDPGSSAAEPVRARAIASLAEFWDEMSAKAANPFDWGANQLTQWLAQSPYKMEATPYSFPNSWWAEYGQTSMRHALTDALAGGDLPAATLRSEKPRLFIGAAEILTGEGRAISGDGATIEHLLASATLPEMFPAHQPRTGNRWDGTYWDGLFSMNPPIAAFMDLPEDEIPDEIWVVRINPKGRSEVPRGWVEIADRRNELAGNLSLDQEIAQVRRINEYVRSLSGFNPHGRRAYKEIKVRELWLDGSQMSQPMTLASKLDRSPDFIQELIRHGRAQADRFLAELPARVA